MQQKITLTGIERFFLLESNKKMPAIYPKAQTLHFIQQFACVYHTERKLPPPLGAMILN